MVKVSYFIFMLFLSSCTSLTFRGLASSFDCRRGVSVFFSQYHESVKKRITHEIPHDGLEEVKSKDLVLVDELLREEVEKKRALYHRAAQKLQIDPDNLLFKKRLERINMKFKDAKKRLGKGVINSTLRDSAIELDKVIITRAMNSGANTFIGHRAISKPSFIKAKTAKYGLIKGLIPIDQSLVARDLAPETLNKYKTYIQEALETGEVFLQKIETAQGVLVIRDGSQQFTQEVRSTDKVIEVLADSNGDKYTADVDLYAVGGKNTDKSYPYFSYDFGYTTDQELKTINEINHIYSIHDTHRNIERDLIMHGSEIHNPNPVELDFPMRAYLPDGRIVNILEGPESSPYLNLDRFIIWAQSNGYCF